MVSYFTTIFYFSDFSGSFQQYPPNSPPDLNSSVDKYKLKKWKYKIIHKTLKFLELEILILIISKIERELKFVIQEIFEFTIVMS